MPKSAQQMTGVLKGAESAEAAAWLSVARDDAHALAYALPHLSINVADEDGDTLLLCACRFVFICCSMQPWHDDDASFISTDAVAPPVRCC